MQDRAPLTRFGPFELDTRKLELRCNGTIVHLEPRPLRVLLYLLEHRDRIVPKQELFEAVWPEQIVGDAALAGALRNVRRALDDDGSRQRWIRTRRRMGYQFAGAVEPDDVAVPATAPRRRIFGSPRGLSMCFVGRDAEVAQLESLLEPAAHMSVQVCVEGLAGIGKTELALQTAHRLARAGRLAGGIFWLDAEGSDLRATWGGEIADQYGVRFGPVEARCAQLLRVLENEPEPLLIVLDNVEDWQPDARPSPLPRGPHISVLVTTRRHNLAAAQFRHLELGLLATPHDRELLCALAGDDPSPGAAELLAHLAGHALALELAGAFLGTFPAETPLSYLRALRRGSDSVERAIADRTHDRRTLGEAFRTIWDRLPDSARDAWWLASFFESGPVSQEIAHASGITREALHQLESAHVIQFDGDGHWTMHQLVREFGQRSGPEPLGALSMLLAMGPQLVHRSQGGGELRRVYQRAVELASNTAQVDEVLRALDGLWHARVWQGAWHDAAEIARMIDELTANGASPRQRLMAHRAWGGVHFYTGDLERASAWLEPGVALCRAELALTRTVTDAGVFVLSHAAMTSAMCGFPDRAMRLIDEAETLARRLGTPLTLAMALFDRVAILTTLRDVAPIAGCLAELGELHRLHELAVFDQIAAPTTVWVNASVSTGGADVAAIQAARSAILQSKTFILLPASYALLAEVCSRIGERELGLDLIDDAMRLIESTGEHHYEPELWRVRGALASSHSEALECFERGVKVAQAQHARLFELRCATAFLELALGTEASPDARQRLREIYAQFSEGFERPDLVHARRALAAPQHA